MPATTTTTEVFPLGSFGLEDVQNEQRLRIKAGAIRSGIDQSNPTQIILKTEWNVLGQNDDLTMPSVLLPAAVPAQATPASTTTEQNIIDLATIIMSEASVGNTAERLSVAFTLVNRMIKSGVSSVRDVWRAYSHNQQPAPAIVSLARDTLSGQHADPTGGCTHYYSPRSMPTEGQPTSGFNVAGGLELVPPLVARNYVPGWAQTMNVVHVSGVRPDYFKFYKV